MKKYDFYHDPSHGWLKVKRQELIVRSAIIKLKSESEVRKHAIKTDSQTVGE